VVLDEYYGLKKTDKTDELSQELYKIGVEELRSQFLTIYNVIRSVIDVSEKNLRDLLFNDNAQRIPRYFQVIFLALHKLIFKENKEVNSYTLLVEKLQGIAAHIRITEGGNWSSANRN